MKTRLYQVRRLDISKLKFEQKEELAFLGTFHEPVARGNIQVGEVESKTPL